jgi:hypothetical protein
MKNSKLALKIFLVLTLLGGLITILIIKPFFILFMGIALFIMYVLFAAISALEHYVNFDKKYNIFYQIGKFLDSFPQIIKNKK